MAKKPTRKPKAKPKGAAKPKPTRKKPVAGKRPPAHVMRTPAKAKSAVKRHPARKPTKAVTRPKRRVRSQQLVAARDYGLTLASIQAHEARPAPVTAPGRKIRMFFVMASPNQ